MEFKNILAIRTSNIKASAIRELLKAGVDKKIISFGGGLPSPDSFPVELLEELTRKVIKKYGPAALQYDTTEGFTPLRKLLLEYCASNGIHANLENLYITSGSQGLLDAIGKLFINPGDYIAVEGPTYLAALQAFNAYEARYIQMETDDEGLIPESVEDVVANNKIKFVYAVPTFQNPSGKTVGVQRREAIAEIIKKYNVLFVEDDPYSALRYKGEKMPTIKSFAPDNVIYVSTISKIFAPGLRIGYFVAPEKLGRWLVLIKQGVDLNTCTYTQALATEYLAGGYVSAQVKKILDIYKPKLEAMTDSIKKYFPEEFKFSNPDGGMFLWGEGSNEIDTETILKESLQKGVSFVPGKFFYPNAGDGLGTMRLNFTNVSVEEIKSGIEILGSILKEEYRKLEE